MIDQVNGMPVYFIDTEQALAEAAEGWLQRELVALDTEFMRVRTYYAHAALFQLCDGESCFLIDPLAVADLGPLARLLAAPSVLKLMHSCSEDLEVCDRRLGALPEPLIDTQVAAAFCGHVLSAGYQKMLASELDVTLQKSETRTDWLQRPLSSSQLRYAAEDVAYLPALWRSLQQRLAELPAAQWVREECDGLLQRFRARDSQQSYRGIGGAWRLDPAALARLRALAIWRETLARERDLPRNWVVQDAVLLQLAERAPLGVAQLEEFAELHPGSRRRYGQEIVSCIAAAAQCSAEELPPPVPAPPDAAAARMAKTLRAQVVARGEALGVAPEMLARRRDFEELYRVRADPGSASEVAVMQGWRREVIGEQLLEMARQWQK